MIRSILQPPPRPTPATAPYKPLGQPVMVDPNDVIASWSYDEAVNELTIEIAAGPASASLGLEGAYFFWPLLDNVGNRVNGAIPADARVKPFLQKLSGDENTGVYLGVGYSDGMDMPGGDRAAFSWLGMDSASSRSIYGCSIKLESAAYGTVIDANPNNLNLGVAGSTDTAPNDGRNGVAYYNSFGVDYALDPPAYTGLHTSRVVANSWFAETDWHALVQVERGALTAGPLTYVVKPGFYSDHGVSNLVLP